MADTHTAASASYADVATAYALCSSGDTLVIPAGTQTWATQLVITIGLTVQGAGKTLLLLTNGTSGGDGYLIRYQPATPSLDEPFNLSGISFDGVGKTKRGLRLYNPDCEHPISKVKVWGCRFYQNIIGFLSDGAVYGVGYNNEYDGNGMDTEVVGADQESWDHLAAEFGTSHAFFHEDNTIVNGSTIFENSNGAQFVFRYNTIIDWNVAGVADVHGNNAWPVGTPDYTDPARTILNSEIYENTFTAIRSDSIRWFYQRGGAVLMYNNTMRGNGINQSTCYVQMHEEDDRNDYIIPAVVLHNGTHYRCKVEIAISTATMEPGVGATWGTYWDVVVGDLPVRDLTWGLGRAYKYSTSYDPIIDSYYYNNTDDGGAIEIPYFGDANSHLYVVENVNYFLTNPVGQTIKGAVYAPYTYPHPLRGEKFVLIFK